MKVTLIDSVQAIEATVQMPVVPREGEAIYPPDVFNRSLMRVLSVTWDISSVFEPVSVRVLLQ